MAQELRKPWRSQMSPDKTSRRALLAGVPAITAAGLAVGPVGNIAAMAAGVPPALSAGDERLFALLRQHLAAWRGLQAFYKQFYRERGVEAEKPPEEETAPFWATMKEAVEEIAAIADDDTGWWLDDLGALAQRILS